MKLRHASLAIAAAALLMAGASAQTTTQTKVDHDTDVKNGVATTTTKVTHVRKHKTRQPKKILGVKVGHKTVTNKTVRETKVSTDGDTSTKVTTSH